MNNAKQKKNNPKLIYLYTEEEEEQVEETSVRENEMERKLSKEEEM